MNRKDTTRFLTDLLISRRLVRRYYAEEVTLDYGTSHPKRVDVIEFRPQGVMSVSDIEKGEFICYEIKSCYEDVYSGNGLNFYGERNYIVTTMQTFKKLQEDMRSGKLEEHIKSVMGVNTCPYYGIIVPVHQDLVLDYENPVELDIDKHWDLVTINQQPKPNRRSRSMTELLFCMLRSKQIYRMEGEE